MEKTLTDCKVLIVDDTETNIDILVETLEDKYELSVAMDGHSALECVELEKPDLILLDIMMPELDGYKVCEKLKKNEKTKDIPIIFLTAITDVGSKAKGFEAGAVDYITKPFESIEVQARVKTHLSLESARKELLNQNEILEERVKERTREIELTQEAMIDAFATLAEYRDPETGGHIKRTKNYVKVMATKLSTLNEYKEFLTKDVIEKYYSSAPLHDIGKIGIRDEILLKPGRLTSEEFDEMKKHTLLGLKVLEEASQNLGEKSFLKYAMEFSKYHHERWDGKGYPEGLSKADIPLAGRIMAIADVYDALISKRVYKPAFSHEEAVELIRQGSNSQFDPSLVDVFLGISNQFYDISQKYKDE